ncbi:MAG TPA: AMP-binding protein [Mariprofundaceae bacterium]|nr:AMP-binding protein [Mariprofundaceae bacterium]
MSRVLEAVIDHAARSRSAMALQGQSVSLSYKQLWHAVCELTGRLRGDGVRSVAILADNSPACAVADLACVAMGIPCVPIPLFFSPEQVRHLLTATGVNTLLTDMPERALPLLDALQVPYNQRADWEHETGIGLQVIDLEDVMPRIPHGVAKVTFTSGTTGEPKGVCLSQQAMEQVADSLARVSGATPADRHLSMLPHATLLENIGGLYACMLTGATCCLPGLEAVGARGASGLDVRRFAQSFGQHEASTCILIPQMLLALVSAMAHGTPHPASLRFIAVGGAPVSPHLLRQAARLGLPVYEGYGLSEAASVVAVNRPGAARFGTVGQPLPHVRLRFAEDGEIEVAGSLFSGYLHDPDTEVGEFWPTGDIGHLDDEGFLHLTGRKKHIFITSFGRNVAPEWVERELTVTKAIAQAVVFGEARPFNVAVLVPRGAADAGAIASSVAEANARLPDYAQVRRWIIADSPFSLDNGQWTGTGRPRRTVIGKAYAKRIEAIYKEEDSDGIL